MNHDYSHMPAKKKKSKEEQLCDAMLDLLAEKPFDEIKINDILQQADCCRATMYKYFKNKEEIIQRIVYDEAVAYVEILRKSYLSIQDEPAAKARHARWPAEQFYEHVYQRQPVYNIIIDDLSFPGMRDYFCKAIFRLAKKNITFDEAKLGIPEEMVDFWRFAGTALYLVSVEWWANHNWKYSTSYVAYLFISYISPKTFFFPNFIAEEDLQF